MQAIILSHLLAVFVVIVGNNCDARSTRVSAQYTVGDGAEPKRTFGSRGTVEDAVLEDGGILTKSPKPTRNSPRGQKRRPSFQSSHNPASEYEQLSFQPEIFALKGQVLDDDEPTPAKPRSKSRPTRGKTSIKHSVVHPLPSQSASTKNPFRFPSIQNEEIFDGKLQKAPSALNTKKYKAPGGAEDSIYTYSTIKFSGDDDDNDDSYVGKTKAKAPKRSTSIKPAQLFNLEQSFTSGPTYNNNDDDVEAQFSGFKPSAKFSKQKSAGKLYKTPEDDFKESEFFDFSVRPRPGQSSVGVSPAIYKKFESDLGVKSLAIKAHKNKFDPSLQGGFKPSFKLRDFPNLHGSDRGSGIASPGQIKSYYDTAEAERDERYRQKLLNDPHPASKAQFAQFLRAKEDERLEKIVEEQFKLQQQKAIAQEKEAELKHQQAQLQRQKEKLKQVEKHLTSKVTRQSTRQKRRPNSANLPRRQRNPSALNFSVAGNGDRSIPLRTHKANDGTYRVSFNVQ